MKNKLKSNKVLLVIIIILLAIGLFYIIFNNSKQKYNNIKQDPLVEISSSISIEDIYKNMSSYENKLVRIEGYIYHEDILSETMNGNLYINLRNIPNMEENNGVFSIKIESENIRNLLINKYNNNNSQWVKVGATGVLHSVIFPMNGTSAKSIYMQVNTLNIE